MEQMKNEIVGLINSVYGSQSECAKAMGWPRQRLNKLVCGSKEPDVSELGALAGALHCEVSVVADIFLRFWSPNGQQTA